MRTSLFLMAAALAAACGPPDQGPEIPDGRVELPPGPAGRETAIEDVPSTVPISETDRTADQLTVGLDYNRRADLPGPRLAELFVRLGAGLRYVSVERGGALLAADKRLVVQDQGGGVLRLVVLSTTNLNELESGRLADLTLERVGGGGAETVALDHERSSFAPAEADAGWSLTEPLVVGADR